MINKKLYSININSLNILDVLLREKSATATGKILNLSQSAVSIVLKNLREIFDDELLTRNTKKNQLELTPLALNIREPLRRVIEDIEKIIFNTSNQMTFLFSRNLKIALTDSSLMLFAPKLLKKINMVFPKVTIDIFNLFPEAYISQLNEGYIDIAAGALSTLSEPDEIYYKFLMKDHIVCVAGRGHPVLNKSKITLKEYRQYPKILSKFIKSPYDITNETTVEYSNIPGHESDSLETLLLPNTLGTVPILLETKRIALCGSLTYKKVSQYFDVGFTKPDFDVSSIDYTICCLQKYKNDPVIKTVIDIFSEIAQEYVL